MAERCLIIAEVAQAHDGSLGTAHAYIDAAAKAGADAVKFQMHIAREESTPHEPWRIAFSRQDSTRYDYWKRMEFSPEQWREIQAHCEEAGVAFLCSPFSLAAVEILKEMGMPAWKVASGEVFSQDMFDAMAETGWPMWVSTGMIGWAEVGAVAQKVLQRGLDLTLFQCTSAYPTPPEQVGLNVIQAYRDTFGCKVGLSDHSGKIFAGLAAAALGVNAIEVHLTWHRECFGPDVSSSLTISEFNHLVQGVREIECMHQNPVDKDDIAEQMATMRSLFTKSLVLRETTPKGTQLTVHHLVAKKPGTGIPASRLHEFVGRELTVDLDADTLLMEEHVA